MIHSIKVLTLSLIPLLSFYCPQNEDDILMFHLYHKMDREINRSVAGTRIEPAYLAALISLESSPLANRNSERFEPGFYKRLLELKETGRPFGGIPRSYLLSKTDRELKELSTSYGLTQIMGFHCIELGCSIDDLRGDYHLQWAVAWMQKHYGNKIKTHNWQACFRIHNTGHPKGETARRDYVERGISRMKYYREWVKKKGSLFY